MDEKRFDKALFDAFDRMGPSAQTEDRMLAALLAAHEEAEAPGGFGGKASPGAFVPATSRANGAVRRDRSASRTASGRRSASRAPGRGWKIALSAACIALVAVVGAGALAAHEANTMNQMTAASSSNASAPVIATKPAPEALAPNEASPVEPENAAEPEDAAGSDAAAPSGDVAARYPFVTLSSGIELRVALGEDGPLVAEAAVAGDVLEEATAVSGDGSATVSCTVFASNDPAHPYAVRFDGDERFYLADEVAR